MPSTILPCVPSLGSLTEIVTGTPVAAPSPTSVAFKVITASSVTGVTGTGMSVVLASLCPPAADACRPAVNLKPPVLSL